MRCKGSDFLPTPQIFYKLFPPRQVLRKSFCIFVGMNEVKYNILLIFAILNGKISEALNHYFKKNFNLYSVDLQPDEWIVLHCLWQIDGATQQELCNTTLADKTSMTRLLDRMEEKQLIERRISKTDKRVKHVHLLPLALDIKEKAKFVANKTLKEVLRGLHEDELFASQEVLRMVFSNCSAKR